MQKRVISENVKFNKNNLLAAFVLVLLISAFSYGTGETLSYLAANTEPVTNTFVYGDIDIALRETTGNKYIFLPGTNIKKDPKIAVKAGSVDCYLFAEVLAEGFPQDDVSYEPAAGWKKGDGGLNQWIWYREVAKSDKDQEFGLFFNDEIKVSDTFTMDDAKTLSNAKITIKAYAVQKAGITSAYDAWQKVEADGRNNVVPSVDWIS